MGKQLGTERFVGGCGRNEFGTCERQPNDQGNLSLSHWYIFLAGKWLTWVDASFVEREG
jgi:hypothetical protein